MRPKAFREAVRRRSGKNRANKKAEVTTWTGEWEEFTSQRLDPGGGEGQQLAFVWLPAGFTVASFACLVPPFLDELQKLQAEGNLALESFCLSADTTFNVESNKWTYTMLTVPVYRCLEGFWRKTGWPICFLRHCTEENDCYVEAIAALKAELARRKLPAPCQIHHDFRRGLDAKTRGEFKTVVQDLEHMVANLRSKRSPHLHMRQFQVLRNIIYTSSTMPTWSQFHLCWIITLGRISNVWEIRSLPSTFNASI